MTRMSLLFLSKTPANLPKQAFDIHRFDPKIDLLKITI